MKKLQFPALLVFGLPVVAFELVTADTLNDRLTMIAFALLLVFFEWSRQKAFAARRELARSREELAFAQAAAHVGSWGVGADGTETWSETFRELLGVTVDTEASPEVFLAHVHPDDRAAVAVADALMLSEPGDHEYEYRVLREDGSVRSMIARGRCVVDATGARKRVHGVAIDITDRTVQETERIELEQQLIHAQKLETVGRLAGGVAHDFNNVLTGISGFAELARARAETGESPLMEIDEITAGAARAAALTRQLLAFSRKQVMRAEVLDLNDVVRGTDALFERLIGEDIGIAHSLRRDNVLVRGDKTQLEQVLLNLVVNARDAMPDGGRIEIEINEVDVGPDHSLDLEPGRFALLAVSDTGVGMDPQTVGQIFDPFFTTKPDGTGLGLATVYGIVRQSGGTIWVYSEPGAGTVFKVYLPLAGEAIMSPAAEPLAHVPDGAGEHVLVIEDDRQVRSIVKQMLTRRGYSVVTADGPEAALVAAGAGARFDAILSDLVMPNGGGRQLVAQLVASQPHAAVVFMSGYSDDAVRTRGVVDPGTAFIEKPFSSDDLVLLLRQTIAGRREAA
jgi:PAS domain S-box-containing protein